MSRGQRVYKFQKGELARVASHCKEGGRLVLVVEVPEWSTNWVYIRYMDGPTKWIEDGKGARAMNSNLERLCPF